MILRGRPSFRWPATAVLVLAVTGLFSRQPVIDALTGAAVPGLRLAFSPAYLVIAPIGSVLDQLSLLTDRQHIAVVVSLILGYAAWRVARRVAGGPRRRGLLRETLLAAGSLTVLVCVYGYGVLGRRPMARLHTADPDIAIVDFHSHTEASHDGRAGFGIAALREWHSSSGFDLVYVTDHATVSAAVGALDENPARAGDGTSLLVGQEVVYEGQHVLVLGSSDPTVAESALHPWPVLIQTLPDDLSRVPVADQADDGGVQGIELVDADPRGLRQSDEEHARILAVADSLNLALVAGSNNHGWGRTAAGWTLMRIPGWRGQSPEDVGLEIENQIRSLRVGATQVVERHRLDPAPWGERSSTVELIGAVTTLPRLIWHVLVSLTLSERLAWLGWVAIGALLLAWRRMGMRGEPTSTRGVSAGGAIPTGPPGGR